MTSKSSNLAVKKALKFSRFSGHVTITPQGLKRDLPSLGRDTCLHLEWRDVSSSTTRYFRKETCWNRLKSNWLAGTEMVCWRQLNWKQASGMQNLLSCMQLPQWLRPNMPQASCIIFFVCFLPGLEKGGLKDIPGDLQVVLTAFSLGSCLLDWKLPSRIFAPKHMPETPSCYILPGDSESNWCRWQRCDRLHRVSCVLTGLEKLHGTYWWEMWEIRVPCKRLNTVRNREKSVKCCETVCMESVCVSPRQQPLTGSTLLRTIFCASLDIAFTSPWYLRWLQNSGFPGRCLLASFPSFRSRWEWKHQPERVASLASLAIRWCRTSHS